MRMMCDVKTLCRTARPRSIWTVAVPQIATADERGLITARTRCALSGISSAKICFLVSEHQASALSICQDLDRNALQLS